MATLQTPLNLSGTMDRKTLLERIKSVILALEPDAEIYLYGSRARGDWDEDSDWDVLVLVQGEVTPARKMQIWDAIYEIELAASTNIGVTVKSLDEWRTDGLFHATPFYKTVQHDAVPL